MKKNLANPLNHLIFASTLALLPLSASAAPRATALCTDIRTHLAGGPIGSGRLIHYLGQELLTQEGDQVLMQFQPDPLSGFSGNTITYERIARRDAESLGFKLDANIALYMLHGDEGLPGEYVILPTHLDEIATGHFQALYGNSTSTGEFDPFLATVMNCELH